MVDIKREIQEMKEYHKSWMDIYDKEIRQFEEQYGTKYCEYYVFRLRMSTGHRTAWNTLNEIERKL